MSTKRSFFGQQPMPFAPPYYPHSYGPNYGPYGPNWVPMTDARSLCPQMWSSNDTYCRLPNSTTPNDHSSDCCLSVENRGGCRRKEEDTDKVVINEMTETTPMDEQLNAMEDTIEELGQYKQRLMQTKLDFLDSTESQAIKALEKHESDLKKAVELIKCAVIRYEDDDTIRGQWMSSADRVYKALVKIADLKEWVEKTITAQKSKIMDDENESYGVALINSRLSKEMPDLWPIYKSLIDNSLVSTESPKKTKPDDDLGVMSPMSRLEAALNDIDIKDNMDSIPEKNDPMPKNKDPMPENHNLIDLKSEPSKVGQTFGDDRFPIIELPFFTTVKSPNVVPQQNGYVDRPEVCDTTQTLKPNILFEPIPELKAKALEKKTNVKTSKENLISLSSTPSPPIESHSHNGNVLKPIAKTNETTVKSRSAHQQKIVDKLKAIYSDMAEEELWGAMTNTKRMFIEFGNKTGFNGMKVTEVVDAISSYIKSIAESTPKSSPSKPNGKSSSNICVLCLKQIFTIADKMTLSCGHPFHYNCLEDYAQTNNRCPKCSGSF